MTHETPLVTRRDFLLAGSVIGGLAAIGEPLVTDSTAEEPKAKEQTSAITCDVFVYGSTPGGVAAAVEAARRGCKVVLACPKNHAGGMAASGLSTTDAVRREMFGGLMLEFIEGVRARNICKPWGWIRLSGN